MVTNSQGSSYGKWDISLCILKSSDRIMVSRDALGRLQQGRCEVLKWQKMVSTLSDAKKKKKLN